MKKMKFIVTLMLIVASFCSFNCYAASSKEGSNTTTCQTAQTTKDTKSTNSKKKIIFNRLKRPAEISPWGAAGAASKVYHIDYGIGGYVVCEVEGELTGDLAGGDFVGAQNDADGGITVYYYTYYWYEENSDEFPEIRFVKVKPPKNYIKFNKVRSKHEPDFEYGSEKAWYACYYYSSKRGKPAKFNGSIYHYDFKKDKIIRDVYKSRIEDANFEELDNGSVVLASVDIGEYEGW